MRGAVSLALCIPQRYGLPEDVWFHVEDMSSAHVYLRQKEGEKLEDISPELLEECAQLTKANSIEGKIELW